MLAGRAMLSPMAQPPGTGHPPPELDDDEEADADLDEAWDAELDRRIADVREGRVKLIPLEEVQADIRAMLARMKREREAAAGVAPPKPTRKASNGASPARPGRRTGRGPRST